VYGRTYTNTYLITFSVGPFCVHTHTLAPSIQPLLKALAEGFFVNLLEFGSGIRFDVLHGCETCSPEAHFQSMEQPKVTWSEIRRVRWLGVTGMFFSARNCCTTSDVWISELLWCRNHCPCHLSCHFLRTASHNLWKNFHVEMTSNNLSRRYKLIVHRNVHVKQFRELFDCPSLY
jgi:hypothetical protein